MRTLLEEHEQSDCAQAQAQAQAQVTMAAHSEVGFLELENKKFGVMLGEVPNSPSNSKANEDVFQGVAIVPGTAGKVFHPTYASPS